MLKSKKILFILTGSIACYKACSVLSKLKQNGYELKVVLSPSSLEFIGAATIEGLTGEPVITEMYAHGHAMEHINLMRWADLIVVAPATANYINKIANGVGDDLLTTLFLAHDFTKPFLIAPAMNTKMYLHPTTQDSIQKLKKMNIEILETASGVLACGEIGSGRLLEPDLIYSEITQRLQTPTQNSELTYHVSPHHDSTELDANSKIKNPNYKKIKVLITSGGTSEAIDDVRVITNKSTGKTAAQIATQLAEAGLDITYLHSEQAALPFGIKSKKSFYSFNDLENLLTAELKNNGYDYIIHAAAVSDYAVVPTAGKINSNVEEITLKLKKNKKLINLIKEISPTSQLIGFKLTSHANETLITEKVSALFTKAHCDLVVHNDWQNISQGHRQFRLYENNLKFINLDSVEALTFQLFQYIIQKQGAHK